MLGHTYVIHTHPSSMVNNYAALKQLKLFISTKWCFKFQY